MSSGHALGAVQFRMATPLAPGAVAVIELVGNVDAALGQLIGAGPWSKGACHLRSLAGIDTALVVRVSEALAWLMPHGGPRIVQNLARWLAANGVAPLAQPDPIVEYPEAASEIDALALAAVSRAVSPLALDLLLDQHRRWAERADDPCESMESMRARSRLLNRLIVPPLVVVVGRPNVGKSTLANVLLGRAGSIASARAGTTRDYVLSRIDLAGLVVDWCDTPGRYETTDQVDREAMALSSELIDRADCLISASAPGIGESDLPRPADLRIHLKADCGEPADSAVADVRVSATSGAGLPELVRRIRSILVPPTILTHPGPWLFDQRIATA